METDMDMEGGYSDPNAAQWENANYTQFPPAENPVIDTSPSIVHEYQPGYTIPDPASVAEFGRTWTGYKEDHYFLPNDNYEQDRLDLCHQYWLVVLNHRLHLAPLRNLSHVLDIGCGTGIWTIEFAEKYPSAQVVGTDLSLIQPLHKAPANCSFIRDDIEDVWIFDQAFDYVHMRQMFSCFYDHKSVIKTLYQNMAEGGWLEYQDVLFHADCIDESLNGTNLQRWIVMINQALSNLERELYVPVKYKDWLRSVGFMDVVEKKIVCPGNPWPEGHEQKRRGRWAMEAALKSVPSISIKLMSRGLDMPLEEVQEWIQKVQTDLRNTNIHFYWNHYIVIGKKPFDWRARRARPSTVGD